MVVEQTPYQLVVELQRTVKVLISGLSVDAMPHEEKNLLKQLKAMLADMRLDIRDYDLAETRAEQLGLVTEVKERVGGIRGHVILLSTYNVFSAIDVAHITARLEYISERLR